MMKRLFVIMMLFVVAFSTTSCKKESKETSAKTTVQSKASVTDAEGEYEGSILGYEVFKVKLDMDKSALITRAKAKDNATTKLGTWSFADNVVTVTTDNQVNERFYVTNNSLVFLPSGVNALTETLLKDNQLKKLN